MKNKNDIRNKINHILRMTSKLPKTNSMIDFENRPDDPIQFMINEIINYKGKSLEIANLVEFMYKEVVKYDPNVKSWFVCKDNNNIWVEKKEQPAVFHEKIIKSIIMLLERKSNEIKHQSITTSNPEIAQMNQKRQDVIVKILNDIRDDTNIVKIIKSSKALLTDINFKEKNIDMKSYLFAFNNCVFDCTNMKMRKIQPEDYICMNTGYDFEEPDADSKKEIIDFIKSILPENYQYCIDTLSLILFGENKFNLFFIWSGKELGNGKSTLCNLVKNALGNYYTTLNKSYLTRHTQDQNETSPLSYMKGIRMIQVSEPPLSTKKKSNKLIAAKIKEITDNEEISARAAYKNRPDRFIPQFIPILVCNEVPDIDVVEPAIARRLKVIDFPMKFRHNPDTSKGEIKADPDLSNRFSKDPKYRLALIALLIENFIDKVGKKNYMFDTPESIERFR